MKTLILLEMAILEGGALVNRRAVRGESWEQVLVSEAPGKSGSGIRVTIAVLILTTLLLSGDEVGLGGAAALFGGLAALGYVLGALGWLGPALPKVEAELFG